MRWLVALATAWCLLGAGAVRVEVRAEHGHQAQIVAPAHGTGHAASRLAAFVAPERVAGLQPPLAYIVERTDGGGSVADIAAPEPVSRGPPPRG